MTMDAARTQTRELLTTTTGQPASDGAGVKLTRIIGTQALDVLDPFLLLDAFESDRPDDYIGGFPSHPHRGFETVTYLLAGRMRHKDNAGNEGVIEPGGVQWMTAGRGIVHSEMPEQEDGLLMGFQLWVNLPASAKMSEPGYQEFPPAKVPLETRTNGTAIRVISGVTDEGTRGPVENRHVNPIYMDVTLPAGQTFGQAVEAGSNSFIFVIEGELLIGDNRKPLGWRTMGVLGDGTRVLATAGDQQARFLLVSGQPIKEPIARGGPFVMNTREEILQAFHDFQSGRF